MVKVHTGTSLLGRAVEVPRTPDEATLDRVANPHRGENYIARFTAPELRPSVRLPASRISRCS